MKNLKDNDILNKTNNDKQDENVIDWKKLNINKIEDITNISDDFFLKYKINSLLLRKNKIHNDCQHMIEKDKTISFIDNNNNKTEIIFIKPDIIKSQIIFALKFIFNNFKIEPNIFFYTNNRYKFLNANEFISSQLRKKKQVLLKRWISGLFSNFDMVIRNKTNYYNKTENKSISHINEKNSNQDTIKLKETVSIKSIINKNEQKKIQRKQQRIINLYEFWDKNIINIDFLFLSNAFLLKSQLKEVKEKGTRTIILTQPIHQIHKIHFPIVVNTKNIYSLQFIITLLNSFLSKYYDK